MKILAIGDFHGKFPEKLRREAEKADLIVSIGDYLPFYLKKIFFKYCYKTNVELWEVVGKRKYKAVTLKDLRKGQEVLRKLNNLSVPILTTIGNYDKTQITDTYDLKYTKKSWKWAKQDFFSKIIKKYKNIRRFDYKYVKSKNLIFIGGYGGSFPGHVKSKNYKRYKKKLDSLFKKFKKENKSKKVIFIFHNMPYNCRLDVIRDKNAQEIVRGKHYGSKLIRRIINKHQPVLGIGGHIHENQGKIKIGKTTVVNTGAACEGKAALIDFDEEKGRVKNIKFIQ